MKKLSFILRYLNFLVRAKTRHGVHSPFVFELLTKVIAEKAPFYAFDKIEYLRKQLLLSKKEIEVTDLGTGDSGKRTIAEIAQRSAKPAAQGQLLFRLVNHFKPKHLLELGTSLGLSSLYMAAPDSSAKLITIEGSRATAKAAEENFRKFGAQNIETVTGNFDEVLPVVLEKNLPFDFIFFDGNHRKEPTLRYFEQCLAKAGPQAVFVFDDIHWSAEMEEAWEQIKAHQKVTVTVDLFFLGLVFFRPEQAKEHFLLRAS